ncbi:hypothetical protein S40285_08106 [Stachybotrys chlorohalonatus IBT 40285]|uniref:Rhodopsin domain-containing protein n=1 Tax=Stachybotrys chlorohalonatus (strain IBT 40285) TaxID=1283841 RepID=A0A084R0H4_STAC4|nr:hypothetical protein S40285_08106 [Stachybotrys chlorohalonata IBT 40285]
MSSPQRVITDTNRAPLVQVLGLMFLVIAVLASFVRSGTKIHMIKTLKADDILAIVSSLFAIGQSIAVFVACENGLGNLFDSLSPSNIDTFFRMQSYYAANAMFIASLTCSKLSGAMGLRLLTLDSQRWLILGCEITVGAWGVSALVASLFQCSLPSPWDYTDSARCIDLNTFWTYYSAANIVTDVAIIAIMVDNVRRIQTSWGKKTLVIGVFGCRILVIPAAAAQIYFTGRAYQSEDRTFSLWEVTIAAQLVQCLAIFTVCAPNLKPFLDSLESGQIRVDDMRRQGKSSSNGYPSYPSKNSRNKSGQNSAIVSKPRTRKSTDMFATDGSQRSEIHELVDLSKHKAQASNTVGVEQKRSWDESSRKSHSSQTILIHQSWQVDVQPTPNSAFD